MDGTKQLSSLKTTLELPEPAMNHPSHAARPSSSGTGSNGAGAPESPVSTTSPRTSYPIQPSEAVKARRRSSAATATATASTTAAREGASFALPPPPTRSRKIIQMKPRPQDEKRSAPGPAAPAGGKGTGKRPAAAAAAASGSAGGEASSSKKKQPSATSAAGRKIARKTAHSLIERRRRSKMNEEFAVLKDMIPACEGEMHKLAILQVSLGVSAWDLTTYPRADTIFQASIEYVRYLQDCIEKLKAQREPQAPAETAGAASSSGRESYNTEQQYHHHQQQRQHLHSEEQYSPDVEMIGSNITPSPAVTTRPSSSCISTPSYQRPSASPALRAQQQEEEEEEEEPSPSPSSSSPVQRHEPSSWVSSSSFSAAGTSVEHHRHYSYGGGGGVSSATASPAVGPGWGFGFGGGSAAGSTLTSPALGPLLERGDLDHEATAALLMLNNDRRGTVGSLGNAGAGAGTNASCPGGGGRSSHGRGMSVRDLLSS